MVNREHHYSTWPRFGLPNAQECDHVSSPFWFDRQSHKTRVVNVWRQNQLSRASLNSQSTCYASMILGNSSANLVFAKRVKFLGIFSSSTKALLCCRPFFWRLSVLFTSFIRYCKRLPNLVNAIW